MKIMQKLNFVQRQFCLLKDSQESELSVFQGFDKYIYYLAFIMQGPLYRLKSGVLLQFEGRHQHVDNLLLAVQTLS